MERSYWAQLTRLFRKLDGDRPRPRRFAWGKEDDPMFLEGLKLSYTQKLEKSTSATPKSMDGKPQPKPRKLRVPNGAKVRGVDLIR